MPPATRRLLQRVAAFGLARRPDGATLLVQAPRGAPSWGLPGAVVDHGEHPRDTVVRATAALTGLASEADGVRAVLSDVVAVAGRHGPDVTVHTVRVVYDLADVHDPGLFPAPHAASAHFVPAAAVGARPLLPYAARLLGSGGTGSRGVAAGRPVVDGVLDVPIGEGAAPAEVAAAADEPQPVGVPAIQRPAVYARVVRDGAVLLTRLARSEGIWTLPGGGIDFGEDPLAALAREMHEETGLPVVPGRLLTVDSRRFTGHAPDGRLEDFHGIRLVYEADVPDDVTPRVVEIGGSTDAVEWVPAHRLGRTPLTTLAAGVLKDLI